MVRFLATGDLHYRGTSPRARTDDFPATLEKKLLEVFDLARSNGCLGIIIPGDIVDTPGIALPTLVELCLLLARSPCAIYAVPGNHDLWGGSPETVDRTPYGALTRFGLIRDLSRGSCLVDGVSLTGHGYDSDTDRDLAQYIPHTPLEPFPQHIRVHVAHGMLLQRTPGHVLSRYTLVSDVAALKEAPDVLIVGHEHAGFGVMRVGGTTFVNPGALGRLSASSVEMTRQVRVCLLTLSPETAEAPGGGIETELLPVESARPGQEVLSRTHLRETNDFLSGADAFLTLLEVGIAETPLEIGKVIGEVATAQGLPKEVVDEAVHRVAEASESLGYVSSVW